jgi:hypothetical protein
MASDVRNSGLAGASPLARARIAGCVGVDTLASGSFAGFVASRLIVPGDVVATSNNIVASESLFRLRIVGRLIMMTALEPGLFQARCQCEVAFADDHRRGVPWRTVTLICS